VDVAQHPANFEFSDLPISFSAKANGFRWQRWGTSRTIGKGELKICPNMSPCVHGHATITLTGRKGGACEGPIDHYYYTRGTINTQRLFAKPTLVRFPLSAETC
jgi:hypothetical protein